MRSFDEIFLIGFVDVWHILLRVAVRERECCALYMNHDSMPLFERVKDILQTKCNLRDLIGLHRFRFFKAFSTCSHNFAAHHLLIAAKQDALIGQIRMIFCRIWIDIDELDEEVRIAARSADK